MASYYKTFLDIDNFKNTSILQFDKGPLRGNRFNISFPKNAFLDTVNEWNILEFDCANIGFSIGDNEVNSHMHYYIKTRTDWEFSITFMESADLIIRNSFYRWMNTGFNHQSAERDYIDNVAVNSVKIMPLDNLGYAHRCDVFDGVFPYEVNNIAYNFGEESSMLKTVVRFKYAFHRIESI